MRRSGFQILTVNPTQFLKICKHHDCRNRRSNNYNNECWKWP